MPIHTVYTPFASSTNVLNNNGQIKNAGVGAFSGNVPSATLNEPDDITGSNSYVIPNQSQNLVVSGSTIHGRYDKITVLNNPA